MRIGEASAESVPSETNPEHRNHAYKSSCRHRHRHRHRLVVVVAILIVVVITIVIGIMPSASSSIL